MDGGRTTRRSVQEIALTVGRRPLPAPLTRLGLCFGLAACAVGCVIGGKSGSEDRSDVSRSRAFAEAAPTLGLDLVGQAGGPVTAVLAEPARQLLLVGAGQGLTVLADDLSSSGRVLGRSEPLGAAVVGLAGGADRTIARLAGPPWMAALDLSEAGHPRRLPLTIDLGGPSNDALRDGDRLFLALGGAGLRAYRWPTGAAPSLAWSLPVEGEARQLATLPIQGRRLLLAAAGAGGLLILDVTEEGPPATLAQIRGDVVGVTAFGRLAFLAMRQVGSGSTTPRLAIYDLTRPAAPLRIVEPRPDLTVGDRLVSDGVLLYSCAGSPPSLEAIDVRSPNQPLRRGFSSHLPAPPAWRQCEAVTAAGARVYVASWSPSHSLAPQDRHGGIAAYLRLPSSLLSFQGSADLRGNPGPLAVSTAQAWIGEGAAAGTPGSRLRQVELSDLLRPRLSASLSVDVAPTPLGPGTPTPFSQAPAVREQGLALHLASERRYRRWDLVAGQALQAGDVGLPPPSIGDEGRPALSPWGDALAVSLAGRDPGRIQLLDGDGQGSPILGPAGGLARLGQVTDLLEVQGHLVAAVRQGGLRILTRDPASGSPREIAGLPLPAESLRLAADGPLVFVANGEAGLVAIDLTRPAEPTELHRQRWAGQDSGASTIDLLLLPAPAWNHGRRALVLLEGQGGPAETAPSLLRLIDAADPLRPRELLSREVATGSALAALGDSLLVSGPESHLEVYAVTGLAPTAVPSSTPPPLPSASASPGPGADPSPTMAATEPTASPSPGGQRPRHRAWLPALDLSLTFRKERVLLVDAGAAGGGDEDWRLRLALAAASLADLDPSRDRAALLRFDAQGASLEAVGAAARVHERLGSLRPGRAAPGRLDLALAGLDLAASGFGPPTDRRDAVLLILAGRGALAPGSAAAVDRGLALARASGWRSFAFIDPGEPLLPWERLLGVPARVGRRTDAAGSLALLAAWVLGGWP